MYEKIINVEVVGNEGKKPSLKDNIKRLIGDIKTKASNTWYWCKENKEDLVYLLPVAIAVAGIIKKFIPMPTKIDVERKRIDTTYYDPSTGCHWELRRKLRNDERMELVQRKRDGEYAENILNDMGVLK